MILEKSKCEKCSIRKFNLFNECPPSELSLISKNKLYFNYSKDKILYQEGDEPNGIFCLKSGKVKVCRKSGIGSVNVFKLAKTGDLLGYKALLENKPYSETAVALEESQACFIDRHIFNLALKSSPDFHLKFIKFLNNEFNSTINSVMQSSSQCKKEKLARSIIWVKNIYGLKPNSKITLNYTPSTIDLAEISGLSLTEVTEIMEYFYKERIILKTDKKFSILDYGKLNPFNNLISNVKQV